MSRSNELPAKFGNLDLRVAERCNFGERVCGQALLCVVREVIAAAPSAERFARERREEIALATRRPTVFQREAPFSRCILGRGLQQLLK